MGQLDGTSKSSIMCPGVPGWTAHLGSLLVSQCGQSSPCGQSHVIFPCDLPMFTFYTLPASLLQSCNFLFKLPTQLISPSQIWFIHVQICSASIGYVQMCSALIGYVQMCSASIGYVQMCSASIGYVQMCSASIGYVQMCSASIGYVQMCSASIGYVQMCSASIGYVQMCSASIVYAQSY